MKNLYELSFNELCGYLSDIGENTAKAKIIFTELYRNLSDSITSFPFKEKLIERLETDFYIKRLRIVEKLESTGADKYLFELEDGNLIETVLMKHEYGYSICVSTQVGCNMGCAFCRSGRLKKIRNLTTAEIVNQIVSVSAESGAKISGVAIMGIGEPFDNYDNVMKFIDIIMYQNGLDIGLKHITLSTCGIIPEIYKLAESKTPVNLAISLHAPNNELRNRLMPVNKAYPLSELMKAVNFYSKSRNRRITLEYVMLKGVNDSTEHARQLSELIGDSKCYVNIIRYNSNEGDEFSCSDFEQIMAFYDILKKNKIGVTMRREMGADVNAACGQLRADHIK